jgi:hypothetical protein
MEYGQIIDILNIAFLKIGIDAKPLAQKVQRIQRLGLSFSNGGNIGTARQRPITHEIAATILQCDPLGSRVGGGEVEEERALRPLLVGLFETNATLISRSYVIDKEVCKL